MFKRVAMKIVWGKHFKGFLYACGVSKITLRTALGCQRFPHVVSDGLFGDRLPFFSSADFKDAQDPEKRGLPLTLSFTIIGGPNCLHQCIYTTASSLASLY